MDLILWRHAEAFETADSGDDLDRALTPKGERQAQRMAEWLGRHLPSTTKVLASPAKRCQQTAQALDRKFKTVPALAPDGTVESLLAAVRWPDAREPVLVVGHQPTLGLTAAYLMAGVMQPWSVKKAAVWWLRSRQRLLQREVVLVTVRGPDNV
ncbi:phosphohistidine phosphatase SixA [Calidifontimicrobium sp. SYSU G02091]|uniref:phosphohistidine phosphatase SixA n=1 Tax=Calidifontimicrobium sp. SYSU G02091 TaxID=2926421 RepID=UPI001F530ABF|nr:phosphohistidine phosphatase SixA [Calidifontimicrobium sp. SYSU G02091]MCI1193485.1 phosphohistidine phosphatase SixA [Calidifontimicrobium sp. SYSU G02091]